MLPAAQVTAQQHLHPATMVLLLLRYPSPHPIRELHSPFQPAACWNLASSSFLALLPGCLYFLQPVLFVQRKQL